MPALDHLILLVPSLEPSALSFLSSAGFTLLPGGTHADGLTGNSLLILDDGVCQLSSLLLPSHSCFNRLR